ncbi:MAG: RNA polymerase sigma factor, partial [Thermoanaerobaculia bacterium]
ALYRAAYRIVGNADDAADVVQETVLRAYRALSRFDARASFTTWIHRIAINCSLDLIDSRKRRGHHASEDEDLAALVSHHATPDRVVLGTEMQHAIAKAMRELSGNERTAFVLRHFEGMPLEEIGQILGTRLNATKNTVFRAVKKLREQLQPFTGSLV